MENEEASERSTRDPNEWKTRIERCKAEQWERQKRLVDILMGFIERVTNSEHTATDGELYALPRVADVCSRLL